MQKYSGVLKFFNQERGFGFVFRDGSNDEDFIHVSKVGHLNVESFQDGVTRFVYQLETRSNGKTMATNVEAA